MLRRSLPKGRAHQTDLCELAAHAYLTKRLAMHQQQAQNAAFVALPAVVHPAAPTLELLFVNAKGEVVKVAKNIKQQERLRFILGMLIS